MYGMKVAEHKKQGDEQKNQESGDNKLSLNGDTMGHEKDIK